MCLTEFEVTSEIRLTSGEIVAKGSSLSHKRERIYQKLF